MRENPDASDAASGAGQKDASIADSRRSDRRRTIWIVLVLAVLALGIGAAVLWRSDSSQSASLHGFATYDLIPVRIGGRCGYTDRQGQVVVQPQFDAALLFTNSGLAPVKLGDNWGLVERTGRFRINPQYARLEYLGHNLFRFKVGERYGIVDETGRTVSDPVFDFVREFDDEGMAIAITGGRTGFINRAAEFVIQPQFDEIGHGTDDAARHQQRYFFNGLARARVGERWGYIDRQGRWAINPQYAWVAPFDDEGLAPVASGSGESARVGFINRQGEWVIQPQFRLAYRFGGAPLAAVKVGDRWGFIDRSGQLRINPQFAYVTSFDNASGEWLAPVSIIQGDGSDYRLPYMYGYIGTNGAFRIQPQFQSAREFDINRRATVMLGPGGSGVRTGLYGLIDPTGRYVVNPIYNEIVLTDRGDYFAVRMELRPGATRPYDAEDVLATLAFVGANGAITSSFNHLYCVENN